MKDYDVMAEVTIAKTVTVRAPDAETAQNMAKEALEAMFNRLSRHIYSPSEDDLTIEIGDANEAEEA